MGKSANQRTVAADSRTAAAKPRKSAAKRDEYVPFLVRFQAWWEGVEPSAILHRRNKKQRRPNRAKRIDVGDPVQELPLEHWTRMRLNIIQRVYGEGYLLPGGKEFTADLINPLELDETKSVLDLNAGLGTPARYIASEFGSWVTGLEADRNLANLGNKLSRDAQLKDKAPIRVYDPNHIEIQDRRYQCILSRERLHTVEAKSHLLQECANALAPGGTMLLFEFVLSDPTVRDEPEVQAWIDAEFSPVQVWTEYEFKEALFELKLELKGYYDDSQTYRQIVLKNWDDFTKGLSKEELNQEFVDVMMKEAEVCRTRIKAIEAGHLQVVRVVLHRPRGELLSNW